MASRVERGLMRRQSRVERWSKRRSAMNRLQTAKAVVRLRQRRDLACRLSTFMLDTSVTAASGRLSCDHTPGTNVVVEVWLDQESFNFVPAIALLYTNVCADPIALVAARVYLRCCDARPDARIERSRPRRL